MLLILQQIFYTFGILSWLFVYSMIFISPIKMYYRHVFTGDSRSTTTETTTETTRKTTGETAIKVRNRSNQKDSKISTTPPPHVAILRPLKGLDSNLFLNLESTFLQTYSNFTLYFCIESSSDPVYPLLQQLMAMYPHIKAFIVIGMLLLC
jgi:hypothetical protein